MTQRGFPAPLRVRVEQFAPELGAREANLGRIAAAQARAADDGIDLLVTPELSLTGYDLRDRVHALAEPLESTCFPELAAGPDVVIGTVERGDNFVAYNTAAHLHRGRTLHRHRKLYLPTYGMFDEGRFFGAGDEVRTYEAAGWRIGLLVCEDFWHPALIYLLAIAGVQMIIVPAAAAGRNPRAAVEPPAGDAKARWTSWDIWEALAVSAAAVYGIYVVLANRVGVEGSCAFSGGSLIVSPRGELLARGDSLAEDCPTADCSAEEVAAARRSFCHARDDDPHLVQRELGRLLRERG